MRFLKTVTFFGVVTVLSPDAHAFRTAGELAEFQGGSTGADGGDGDTRVRWANDLVSFHIHSDVAVGLSLEDVASVVNQGMQTWSTPICSALRFQLVGSTTQPAAAADGINTIQMVTDWAARGFSPDAAAVTDVQYEELPDGGWRIAEADIYLDADNQGWALALGAESSPEEERKSLLAVLSHELGHAAGLLHPCETDRTRTEGDAAPSCASVSGAEDTLMYPEYTATQVALSDDDRQGVCYLYEQDSCETQGCSTGEACTDRGCVPTCGGVLCGNDERCQDDQCVSLCDSYECSVGQLCNKTKDCPDYLECRLSDVASGANLSARSDERDPPKQCLPGSSPLGDPCDDSRDCASMACSKDGFCVAACNASADCPTGTECKKSQGGARACVGDALGVIGDACDEANQCWGNQCVAGRSTEPVCTRTCLPGSDSTSSADAAGDCPAGFECGRADGRHVCLPPVVAASCAVAVPLPASVRAPAALAARGVDSERARRRAPSPIRWPWFAAMATSFFLWSRRRSSSVRSACSPSPSDALSDGDSR